MKSAELKNIVRALVGWRNYRAVAMLFGAPAEKTAIRQWRQTPLGQTSLHKLMELKGRHAGERIFIIGNGPSLNKMDLRLLKDEVTIASNGLYTDILFN